MKIKEALEQMDVLDDSQWTQEGAPRVEIVEEMIGAKTTRSEIIAAAPKFSRTNRDLTEGTPDDDEKEPIQEQETQDPSAPLDTSKLEEFADMEPMLPEQFANTVLKEMPKEHLPEVERLLIEQMIEIEAREKQLEEMKRRVKMSLATTRLWIKTLIPDMSNQEAIRAYIQSSQKNRANKAKNISEALNGLKVSDLAKLDPRAPIDRAFARKTGRGGQRPER